MAQKHRNRIAIARPMSIAAAGSKYGQLVVGLIELREGNTDLAVAQFVLAAGHNS
jgi:hypothetical protein